VVGEGQLRVVRHPLTIAELMEITRICVISGEWSMPADGPGSSPAQPQTVGLMPAPSRRRCRWGLRGRRILTTGNLVDQAVELVLDRVDLVVPHLLADEIAGFGDALFDRVRMLRRELLRLILQLVEIDHGHSLQAGPVSRVCGAVPAPGVHPVSLGDRKGVAH
jgi:hypothetical protein